MQTNLHGSKVRSAETPVSAPKNQPPQSYDMIVFCHLRWQFVYQRPQHLISRMSQNMKVLLIEEPIGYEEQQENTAQLLVISDTLHILQPRVKDIESIAALLPHYITNKEASIGWFYSASFTPLLDLFKFETIVYDCMDELTLFKGAPEHLIHQEKYLIANADIVFTGGKSLYESKKQDHSNVYCFPSSVDESHFAQALNGIEIPADIANLQAPVVGYFGVIDERIDLKLLHETALKLPKVYFVMIGPLAKIDESDLPKEENIHYLGMKSYTELPHYLKGFDIAMMPFAINDATKFISPTKTLEYMAAGKPIISTKIKDVVRDYSNCVKLVETADEFCDAITLLFDKRSASSTAGKYTDILKNTSWDATANKMLSIIKEFSK
ncbi:glycosyltransferase [Flavobacterium hercynium]|uniref:Amine oxidase n=1 Tax=Flavobacterium hercynium TaxID=387094 RepID=A0A226H3V3_9FLAO|nr:glycosyltransferase [Flavobacterium hercynium]OXA88999.1 amine oxidase [Flavobacterium hercynium]SMP28081.1 Glycosyltransferase involved in cell wall bisynthesis [Flavobacterium hercynium]